MEIEDEIPWGQSSGAQIQYLKIQLGIIAPEEVHKISNLVALRESHIALDNKTRAAQFEKAIRAYVVRKRLGIPVTVENIREEFLSRQ
jgi:hypothetical protein